MGLVIARRIGEEFVISVKPGTDPAQLAEQLAEGMTIRISNIDRRNAWLEITAPNSIKVLRAELIRPEDQVVGATVL